MEGHPFHPLANEYPLLSDGELELMIKGMRDNGFNPMYPIVWHEGLILDGRNRWLAAKAAGVIPTEIELPPEKDPQMFVEEANEHRRHETQEQMERRRQERIARVANGRQQGKSLRTLAQEEGVSKTQIERDLEAADVPPGTQGPKVTTGRDGKIYPASRAETNGVHTPPVDEEASADEEAKPMDQVGIPIPENLLEVFDSECEQIRQQALTLCRQLARLVNEYAKSPAGQYLRGELRVSGYGDDARWRDTGLIDLLNKLEQMRPWCVVCPYCHAESNPSKRGRNCRCCQGRGWVPYQIFDRRSGTPREYLAAIQELASTGDTE